MDHHASPSQPLLPRRWRAAALTVGVACALGVAVLGLRYHGEDGPGRVDAVLDPALEVESSAAQAVSTLLVALGNPLVILVLVAAIAVVAARGGRWTGSVLAIVGPGLASVGTEFMLKPLVGRTLDGDLAFPSGHTVRAFAVATVCLVLLVDAHRPRRRGVRIALAVAVAALPLGVAWSLVALTWHYSTDTLGGALVSVAVVLGSALVIDLVAARAAALRPLPPTGRLESDGSGQAG